MPRRTCTTKVAAMFAVAISSSLLLVPSTNASFQDSQQGVATITTRFASVHEDAPDTASKLAPSAVPTEPQPAQETDTPTPEEVTPPVKEETPKPVEPQSAPEPTLMVKPSAEPSPTPTPAPSTVSEEIE